MYTDRDDIKEDIRKRLVKIKGIGPEKAEKGSDAVMEYLDSLVERQGGGSPKPGERDEDGIEMVKRPKGIPEEYNYMYWGLEDHQRFLHHFKPVHLGTDYYTNRGIDTKGHGEARLQTLASAPNLEDILSKERIEVRTVDRIVRLVD